MGSVPQIFPKNLVIEDGNNPYQQPSYNIGFQNFRNMMPPSNSTDPESTEKYYRWECLSGSIVCKVGTPDANGKINYLQTDTQKCSDMSDRHPGTMDVPKNCGTSSRGINMPGFLNVKNWGTKEYVIAGCVGIVLIGSIIVIAKKRKA